MKITNRESPYGKKHVANTESLPAMRLHLLGENGQDRIWQRGLQQACEYEKRKQERKQKVLDKIKATGIEYITIRQALQIFTTTRSTIRRLIMKRRVSYRRPSPRKTFVSVKSLETLFPLRPESQVEVKQSHIFDMHPDHCYTIGEISQRFQITECSVYKHIRQYSIPTRQIGRFVYAPKTEIDKLYSNKKSKR